MLQMVELRTALAVQWCYWRNSERTHCQIRLVYSKSGLIAYVRFTRATNRSADDKGDQLYTLACLVNVYLKYAAGDLLHSFSEMDML